MQPGKSIVPDLQIFVSEEAGDPRILSFKASAADPRLGFGTFVDYGQTTLRVDPDRYLDGLFTQLQMAGADADARLEDAGVRLFEDLLPFELRRRLWQARQRIGSLFVVTAEAWIPWELLKLQDPEGNDIGPFFAEAFAMGRWLSVSGPRSSAALHLPLRRLGLIFPADSELPQAQFEKRDLLAHAGESRQVVEIPAERAEIAAAMAEGTFDGWHFCGHGQISRGEIEPGYLQIESDQLDANQLYGRARGLGRQHPLVFLNACYGGRAGEGLAGLAGLPVSFLKVGAGAFIGPLWQVSDRGAALFAQVFYRSFLGGATLGAAVLEARQALRQDDCSDPTWLAYIVLGHPSALCGHGPSPVTGEEETPRLVPMPSAPAAGPRDSIPRGGASRGRRAGTDARPWLPLRARVAAGMLLLGGLFAGLDSWRLPTQVRLEGRASRIVARLGAEGGEALGGGIAFERLTAGRIAAAEVVSGAGEPIPVALEEDGILIAAAPSRIPEAPGALGDLRLAKAERVVWEAERSTRSVALRIEGIAAETFYEVVLPLPFELKSPQSLAAKVHGAGASILCLFPGQNGLLLEAELPLGDDSEPHRRLVARALTLDDLSFSDPISFTGPRSTLHELAISYPGHPGRSAHRLAADGIVEIGSRDVFRATLLDLDPVRGELVFAFEGKASGLRAGTPGNLRDLRLTALDAYGKGLIYVLSLAALIAVCVSGRRFFRSFRFIPAGAGEEMVR